MAASARAPSPSGTAVGAGRAAAARRALPFVLLSRRGQPVPGRSWRTAPLGAASPGSCPAPPGHLRVSEGPPAASGGHGLGRGNRQPEPGRGAGRAVAFRAAGQSAQISLICVTPMNKIARRQPGTIQREPLSEGGRFSGAAGARASVTCLPSAIRQLRTQSTGPSLHTVARRAVLPVPRAVRTVTLCVLWCCSSCCSYSLKSRSPLSEQCILPFHSYRHMCAVFSLLNSSSIEFLKKKKNIYM